MRARAVAGARAGAGLLSSANTGRRSIRTLASQLVPWPPQSVGRETHSLTEAVRPTHLLVLVHGMGGSPDDLAFLRWCVRRRTQGHMLVHSAQCNNEPSRTFDGVSEGGTRLASEVRSIISQHPSLSEISFVGNSLGGIYVRYALALLFDPESSYIAGLQPYTFLSTATPHLGVGPYGFIGRVPEGLKRFLGFKALGRTVKELLLLDTSSDDSRFEPLLVSMANPHADLPYLQALGAFKRRCVYANVVNDAMVAYETAAQTPQPGELSQSTIRQLQQVTGRQQMPQIMHVREREAEPLPDGSLPTDAATQHERIAAGLATLTWREVAVAFPGLFPTAHNKICALQRDPILAWINRDGQAIVEHQADYLVEGIVQRQHELSNGRYEPPLDAEPSTMSRTNSHECFDKNGVYVSDEDHSGNEEGQNSLRAFMRQHFARSSFFSGSVDTTISSTAQREKSQSSHEDIRDSNY